MIDKDTNFFVTTYTAGGDWEIRRRGVVIMTGNDSLQKASAWLADYLKREDRVAKANRRRFDMPVTHIHTDGSVSTLSVMQRAGGGHLTIVASYLSQCGIPDDDICITIFDAAQARALARALTIAADLAEAAG